MRALVAAGIVGLAASAYGCATALVIHREMPRPAAIPARGFPVVYVAAADEGSLDAADAIADHLEGGAIRVVRASPESLLADARVETAATLALLVTVTTTESIRTEMSQVPTTHCSPGMACYGYPERIPVEVRVQVGELTVRAFDPRSHTELGQAFVREQESEPSPLAAQLAVRDRLRMQAPTLFDVQTIVLDLELDPLADPTLRTAIEDARAGHIHQARVLLEQRRESAPDDVARAAITFDLGQLIRADVDTSAADPAVEEATRFAAAEADILEAIQLSPTERHERALAQLRAERTAREDVRAQALAADTNFATVTP